MLPWRWLSKVFLLEQPEAFEPVLFQIRRFGSWPLITRCLVSQYHYNQSIVFTKRKQSCEGNIFVCLEYNKISNTFVEKTTSISFTSFNEFFRPALKSLKNGVSLTEIWLRGWAVWAHGESLFPLPYLFQRSQRTKDVQK